MELRIIPIVSEKSYAQAQKGTYVFKVPLTASKLDIKRAVIAQYKVGVVNITTNVTKGKAVRTFRKGGSWTNGVRADRKKAYVRLNEGDSIPVFAEADAAVAKEKK